VESVIYNDLEKSFMPIRVLETTYINPLLVFQQTVSNPKLADIIVRTIPFKSWFYCHEKRINNQLMNEIFKIGEETITFG